MARKAAIVVSAAFVTIACFMVYWALGGSWGLSAHWGGRYYELPAGLRVADAIDACIFILGTPAILRRAGYPITLVPLKVSHWVTWAFAVILVVSAVMNFASQSNVERFMLAPISVVLSVLCLVIARSPKPSS